jgi:hypothetical protein
MLLAELQATLAAGRPALLIVPTASMAEHLQHQLARRGVAGAPHCVRSLSAWVEDLTPDCRELPPASEILLVERALDIARPREFAAVAGYAGFQEQLLATFQELWSAGLDARELAALTGAGDPLTRVLSAYEELLEQAGAVHRSARLRRAASVLATRPPGTVFFDGFPNFTPAELELVASARPSGVALPDAGGRPAPAPVVIQAPTPEREIEDIAGRILADHARARRPFREYGLILRNPEVYAPIIAVVFERFGIPFRLAQTTRLADHPAVRYLAGLLQAAVDGFDALQTLEILELPGSGLAGDAELDRYDFLLREKAPGAGVLFLLQLAEGFPRIKQFVARLDDLSRWSAERLSPQQWAERCAALPRDWYSLAPLPDGGSHETALECRRLARALDLWGQAAAEAATLLAGETDLAGYLRALQPVLRLTPLRVPDRRRNVVQVLSVYEARQWELPVVFVCGLVERQFPRYHAQNLFFPDGERQRLALLGVRLRTTAELDHEERLLFEMAASRASEQLYLTWPARNEEGGETLASFFLPGGGAPASPVRIREQPPRWTPASGRLAAPVHHDRFSPSLLEHYLQCPFLFFAEGALKLAGPPLTPEERINDLLKGSIIHRAIARWAASGRGPIGPVFDRVFREACARHNLRLNFRAEALEMELRADLERFARFESARAQPRDLVAGPPETDIEYLVDDTSPPFRISGRIDHHEISGDGAVVVVDYKYSTDQRLRVLRREQELGLRLQAPLYLLGLERERGLRPAGMLFYGLREKPSREGWLARGLAPADPDLEILPPQEFRALLDSAALRTLQIVREIHQGHAEVRPRDPGFCREHCRYRQVCRIQL